MGPDQLLEALPQQASTPRTAPQHRYALSRVLLAALAALGEPLGLPALDARGGDLFDAQVAEGGEQVAFDARAAVDKRVGLPVALVPAPDEPVARGSLESDASAHHFERASAGVG